MAENESLDLRDPGGQRWNQVHDAVRRGQPAKNVAKKVGRKLPAALRKAFKELAELGVPFPELMASCHDPKRLERLVRKCQGHEFAHLFAEAAAAEAGKDGQDIVASFLDAIIERVCDQIAQRLAGSTLWPSFPEIRRFFGQVRRHAEPEVNRIATKLAKDPTWSPTASKSKKGERTDPTQEMLNMSLLGMNAK
jgi:hypothetical protein